MIVDGSVLVDWQSKNDIIGKMKIRLEDELIDNVKRKYGVNFPFDASSICAPVASIFHNILS